VTLGEYAVLVAKGTAIAISDRPCHNSYCIVARAIDGRLVEMTDYIHTDLVNSVLFTDT